MPLRKIKSQPDLLAPFTPDVQPLLYLAVSAGDTTGAVPQPKTNQIFGCLICPQVRRTEPSKRMERGIAFHVFPQRRQVHCFPRLRLEKKTAPTIPNEGGQEFA